MKMKEYFIYANTDIITSHTGRNIPVMSILLSAQM